MSVAEAIIQHCIFLYQSRSPTSATSLRSRCSTCSSPWCRRTLGRVLLLILGARTTTRIIIIILVTILADSNSKIRNSNDPNRHPVAEITAPPATIISIPRRKMKEARTGLEVDSVITTTSGHLNDHRHHNPQRLWPQLGPLFKLILPHRPRSESWLLSSIQRIFNKSIPF